MILKDGCRLAFSPSLWALQLFQPPQPCCSADHPLGSTPAHLSSSVFFYPISCSHAHTFCMILRVSHGPVQGGCGTWGVGLTVTQQGVTGWSPQVWGPALGLCRCRPAAAACTPASWSSAAPGGQHSHPRRSVGLLPAAPVPAETLFRWLSLWHQDSRPVSRPQPRWPWSSSGAGASRRGVFLSAAMLGKEICHSSSGAYMPHNPVFLFCHSLGCTGPLLPRPGQGSRTPAAEGGLRGSLTGFDSWGFSSGRQLLWFWEVGCKLLGSQVNIHPLQGFCRALGFLLLDLSGRGGNAVHLLLTAEGARDPHKPYCLPEPPRAAQPNPLSPGILQGPEHQHFHRTLPVRATGSITAES